jgi:nucleotide-binding universal stress UspA family protein
MKGFKKILAAVDLSACSQRALALAIDFAYAEGTQLHVLFVEVIHGEPYDESVKARLESMVKSRLTDRGFVGLDVEYAMERDYVAGPAILRYAKEQDVDLIVMGTHGRRGLRALVLGSVAAEVVREAPCAVLTVRKDGDVGPVDVRRILVPFDFSDYSREALSSAIDVAESAGAKIELLHIVEDRFHPAFYGPFFQSVYDMEPDIEQRSQRHLREEIAVLDAGDIVTKVTAFGGHPARDISRYAERNEIDLVVMSTHGLTGIEHFLMGSVAEKTVSHAPCPVLTVKPARFRRHVETSDTEAAHAH